MTSYHRRHVTSCTLLSDYMTSLHGRVTSRVLYPTTWRHSHQTCDAMHSTRHDVTSQGMWRHVFYTRLHDVTSQKTCDAVYSTRHDVTVERTCDVMCSVLDYMTSLHERRVTPCILPDITSHHRSCDVMCSTPEYMTSLHVRRVTQCILPHMTSQYCSQCKPF